MASDFQNELTVACAAARAGGAAVMQHYGEQQYQTKTGGSPVTAADHAANRAIQDILRSAFPGDAILSEESRDSADRLQARRLWIIDPLDGTKEFLAGIPEFSVMIALLADGALRVGAVYRPADDCLFYAREGNGAFRHVGEVSHPLRVVAPHAPIRAVGSRSHPEPLVESIYTELGATLTPSGSVGVKCALIAEGGCDLYVHPVPYLAEWDTAAPDLILREAAGVVTDCSGSPLTYNKPVPRQPKGILAASSALHERVLPLLADAFRAKTTQ